MAIKLILMPIFLKALLSSKDIIIPANNRKTDKNMPPFNNINKSTAPPTIPVATLFCNSLTIIHQTFYFDSRISLDRELLF